MTCSEGFYKERVLGSDGIRLRKETLVGCAVPALPAVPTGPSLTLTLSRETGAVLPQSWKGSRARAWGHAPNSAPHSNSKTLQQIRKNMCVSGQ